MQVALQQHNFVFSRVTVTPQLDIYVYRIRQQYITVYKRKLCSHIRLPIFCLLFSVETENPNLYLFVFTLFLGLQQKISLFLRLYLYAFLFLWYKYMRKIIKKMYSDIQVKLHFFLLSVLLTYNFLYHISHNGYITSTEHWVQNCILSRKHNF